MTQISKPSQTVLDRFQVRKTKKQKEQFRTWLCETLEREGYTPKVETAKGMMTSHNVVAGDPERADILLGAPVQAALLVWYVVLLVCLWQMMGGKANKHTVNDNTSGVITLLEIALALPVEQRDKVCFVFSTTRKRAWWVLPPFTSSIRSGCAGR